MGWISLDGVRYRAPYGANYGANKLAKLRRCVSQKGFGSKKFGPNKLLPKTNLEKSEEQIEILLKKI